MKKLLILALAIIPCFVIAQTVTTYAGVANDDPENNHTSTTSALSNTYFSYPEGLTFDPSGRLWVTERNKVRMMVSGNIYMRAGTIGGPTFSEGYKNANGTQATFRNPGGMVTDADGNIYVVDMGNHCIRMVAKYVNNSNTQAVTTFAGSAPSAGLPGYGTAGNADGTGTAARFDTPRDICMDANGNMYVTDYLNFTIRKITPGGVVTTLAGSAGNDGTADGTGSVARFGGPWGIAMYDADHIVVTDQWNSNIRMVNINTGEVTTVAGPSSGAGYNDGKLSEAKFRSPKGIVVINGIIYVGDQNMIRAIDIANDEVSTFAGESSSFEVKDGEGSDAHFTEISDIATDGKGYIYVAENSGAVSSHVIRLVSIDDLVAKADFVAAKRNLGVNEKTSLKDISTGSGVTDRLWTITPSNYDIHTGDSASEIIEISFPATGFYKVSLWIDTDYGTNSKEVVNYFTVSTSTNSIQNNADHLFSIHPNPVSDELHILLAPDWSYITTTITVYDQNGRALASIKPGEVLYTGDLPNGIYYIAVLSGDKFGVQKLIVQH